MEYITNEREKAAIRPYVAERLSPDEMFKTIPAPYLRAAAAFVVVLRSAYGHDITSGMRIMPGRDYVTAAQVVVNHGESRALDFLVKGVHLGMRPDLAAKVAEIETANGVTLGLVTWHATGVYAEAR